MPAGELPGATNDRNTPVRRPDHAGAHAAPWILGVLSLVAATLLLFLLRDRLDKAHIALVYLLVVLGSSAAGGRTLGIVLAGAAFLAFNFLFLPPYYTFVIADPFDWLVLVVFLVTSIVAAQLLYRAQRATDLAVRRAEEVDRLAELGAETLSVGRADAALTAIARVIRETMGVEACEVYVLSDVAGRPSSVTRFTDGGASGSAAGDAPGVHTSGSTSARGEPPVLVQWVAQHGRAAAEGADGTSRMLGRPMSSVANERSPRSALDEDICAYLLPLSVHRRIVGVLRLIDASTIRLDPTRQRYLDALAYYAALGIERLTLSAEAERTAGLREADRLKDSLLATVSHDIRTPLTTIRGLAHDIAASGDERALIIEEEVDRLNRFVADMLDLSRLAAGGVPLHIELNAAEDLMGAALQRVLGVSYGRDIRATLDPSEPILLGRFDLGHSIRILGNLLENACKYAPSGTPIDFTVHREHGADGDTLAFRIADRGPGVAKGEADRVFAPFYRPPDAPPDVGSAGLGLAIARALAEAQRGRLTYEPRPGGGSVFTLRLPAVAHADLAHLADLDAP